MKLLDDKKDKHILSLYANSSGDIISSGGGAVNRISSFNESYKLNDILTKKSALDVAMSNKELINVETTVEGYRYGLVLQTGAGFSLRRELFLFSDKYTKEHLSNGSIDSLSSAALGGRGKKKIDLWELISSAVSTVKSEFPLMSVRLYKDGDSFISGDFKRLKILIISLFSLIFEVDTIGDIVVEARNRNGRQEIVFTTRSREERILNGIVDFCNAYPFSSTSAVFTRALCNEMGIGLSVFQEFEHVELTISLASDSYDYGVYAEDDLENQELYKLCMRLFFNRK